MINQHSLLIAIVICTLVIVWSISGEIYYISARANLILLFRIIYSALYLFFNGTKIWNDESVCHTRENQATNFPIRFSRSRIVFSAFPNLPPGRGGSHPSGNGTSGCGESGGGCTDPHNERYSPPGPYRYTRSPTMWPGTGSIHAMLISRTRVRTQCAGSCNIWRRQ